MSLPVSVEAVELRALYTHVLRLGMFHLAIYRGVSLRAQWLALSSHVHLDAILATGVRPAFSQPTLPAKAGDGEMWGQL